MEAKASARYIRVTPMKARRVVNLIRGQQANEALAILKFAPQAASEPVFKVLESAVANARQKADRDQDQEQMFAELKPVPVGAVAPDLGPGRGDDVGDRLDVVVVVVGEQDHVEPPAAPGQLGEDRGRLGGVDQRGLAAAVDQIGVVVRQAADGDQLDHGRPLFSLKLGARGAVCKPGW